jgi:hypothetical protein
MIAQDGAINPDIPSTTDACTAPFSVSVLTATKGRTQKVISVGAYGRPVKGTGSLAITEGFLEHVTVPGLVGLQDLLQGIRPKQALVHGVVKGSRPGDVHPVVSTERLERAAAGALEPDTIARSLTYIAYPPDPFLIMFDRDRTLEDPTHVATADQLFQLLTPLFPAMADVGKLVTYSASSAIRDKHTREWLIPPENFHAYLLVQGNLARFVDLFTVRLWTAGHGYCRLSTPNKQTGVAAILRRAVVDLAVFSPERLDYVAGAEIAKNAPFEQARGAPQLTAGGILDLDALPDVTPEERQDYLAHLEAERARLAPERSRLVTETITAADPTLTPEQVEHQVRERLEQQDGGFLPPDFQLFFYHRTKAVRCKDLTAAYDGRRLADPAEPD